MWWMVVDGWIKRLKFLLDLEVSCFTGLNFCFRYTTPTHHPPPPADLAHLLQHSDEERGMPAFTQLLITKDQNYQAPR